MPFRRYPFGIATPNGVPQLLHMRREIHFENVEKFGEKFPVIIQALHQLADIKNLNPATRAELLIEIHARNLQTLNVVAGWIVP